MANKRTKNKPKSQGRTWTFQPDADVRALVEKLMALDKKDKTAILNDAIKRALGGSADLVISAIERRIAELNSIKDLVSSAAAAESKVKSWEARKAEKRKPPET